MGHGYSMLMVWMEMVIKQSDRIAYLPGRCNEFTALIRMLRLSCIAKITCVHNLNAEMKEKKDDHFKSKVLISHLLRPLASDAWLRPYSSITGTTLDTKKVNGPYVCEACSIQSSYFVVLHTVRACTVKHIKTEKGVHNNLLKGLSHENNNIFNVKI
jgi:hypothetical protein